MTATSRATARRRLRTARRQRRHEWPTTPSADDHISDRANPVLVRDVVQLWRSPFVLVVVSLFSLSMVRVGASMLAADEAVQAVLSRRGFAGIVEFCIAWGWALVPFLTFLSTREEVTGAVAESLLLSGLTPTRILTGKLQSALLRSAGIGGLAAPLLALGYAGRGVTLPTLLLTFGFGILGVVVLTTLAVAGACVCRGLRPRALPIALAAACAALLGIAVCRAVPLLLRATETAAAAGAWWSFGGLALLLLFVAAAAWIAASSAMLQGNHSGSAALRAVALALPLALMLLLAVTAAAVDLPIVAPLAAIAVVVVTAPIWIGASTEDRRGSGSARLLRLPPLLRLPLSPGRGPGLLFVLLLAALTALCGLLLPALLGAAPGFASANPPFGLPPELPRQLCLLALAYQLLYAGLAALIRSGLDHWQVPQARRLARRAVPLIAVATWAVPLLWNGFRGIRSVQWNLAHLLNPVTTVAQVLREGLRADLLPWLGGLAALLWLCSLPALAAAFHPDASASTGTDAEAA